MRLLNKLAIALTAVVIFSGCLPVVCKAQDDNPALQRIITHEPKGNLHSILKEYDGVVRENQRSNPEVAARALQLAGQFASHFGTNEVDKRNGQDEGVKLWRQLNNDYGDTQAAKNVKASLSQLESDIDKRNSADWKYQLLDKLVLLTGKNPSYSYGVALILLAILVKLLMLPLTRKQYSAMREMQRMQPMLKELQKKYKGAELSQKQMELYKEHNVNPFASCFPTLLQLPFLFGVFAAIREYEFAFIHGKFLWIGSPLSSQFPLLAKNLSSPDVVLLVLYSLTNFVTMRMTPATDPSQEQQQKTMAWMTSIMFLWMFWTYKWSSAFVLYWFALNLLTIWQQYELVYKPHQERIRNGEIPAPNATVIDVPPAKSGAGRANVVNEVASNGAKSQPTRVRPRKKK